MKVLKFGGKSLANGTGIQHTLQIILNKIAQKETIVVVVSARGNATDELENLLDKAQKNIPIAAEFAAFKKYQTEGTTADFSRELELLDQLFEGVKLVGDYSKKIKDQVLAQGEVIAAKFLTQLLQDHGVKANFADARQVIKTDSKFGDAQPLEDISRTTVVKYFGEYSPEIVQVVTGFIGSNSNGDTTTLGRNGSNYSASLLANYLDATELQNYTHVDGIFTANPDLVADAKIIEQLSFDEANELTNFGATILHAKTIIPLIAKNIPIRILNTFNAENQGTLITADSVGDGIKSLTVLENVTLITLEGRGLLGKSGVDARIFRALGQNNISVSIISQGSSERGIGLVVNASDSETAKIALEREFELDFYTKDVSEVYLKEDVSVISIIGQELANFNKPFDALIRNQIVPILLNNTVTGRNVSIVLERKYLKKALNVIHGEIFGISKKVNVVVFGVGTVGNTLVDQILNAHENILNRKNIAIHVVAVCSSNKLLTNPKGIQGNWRKDLETKGKTPYELQDVLDFVENAHLENLIAVDVTASKNFVENYTILVSKGFDLVSANKIANTISFDYYKDLRKTLKKYQKNYLYETNVGAGLPLIDTIRVLHHSGENITRIKGVFSGTLSYIFNTYSAENTSFSKVLEAAIAKGFTEPDPREDLCGNDVGRKLLILARELDLENEFEDIQIHNLIPEHLRDAKVDDFLNRLEELNPEYEALKASLDANQVLRYVGELHGDLSKENGAILEVKLVKVSQNSSLGQMKGSDSYFEIFTESYGENPIVIQGAGAGAAVTARGVFGDILRLAEKNHKE